MFDLARASAVVRTPTLSIYMNGILIIDKPAAMTSHDVVNRVRRILGQKSIGHLGTLDPMATGVLPLVAGNLTRLAQFYTGKDKTYEGEIRFGFATDTYDAEGQSTTPMQDVVLSLEKLREIAGRFQGMIEQMPPPFSAKKINGVPAYKLARKKADVTLKSVQVEIKLLAIDAVNGDRANFRSEVSSGTYLRSIAHDMGKELGCGAHLAALRRTGAGDFTLEDAHTLEEVQSAALCGDADDLFIHCRKLLPEIPSVTATDEIASRIRNGLAVNLPEFSRSRQVKVFLGQNDLIAIATRVAGTLFHASIVLAPEIKPVALVGK
jgi:tRNA pseudouridine55 synthase